MKKIIESKEMTFENYINSDKSSKEFLETVEGSAVTSVTDKPPETRIKKPDEDETVINLNKKKEVKEAFSEAYTIISDYIFGKSDIDVIAFTECGGLGCSFSIDVNSLNFKFTDNSLEMTTEYCHVIVDLMHATVTVNSDGRITIISSGINITF